MEPALSESSDIRIVVRRFFSNPVVGMVGSVASIIGLVLAVYFFLQSQQRRELLYLVSPAKAVIVKAGQLSKLAVTLDGKSIDTDVTAAQLAFWNQGNQAIRREHILRPLTLRTAPATPIIDATVRKTSREVVQIDLDKSRLQDGELSISWNILEQGDGAIVQVVFAGPAAVDIPASATIEGQHTIRTVHASSLDRPSEKGSIERSRFFRIVGWVYICLGISTAAMGYYTLRRYPSGRASGFRWLVRVGMPILIAAMGVFTLFFFQQPGPPFGF